MKIKSGVWQWLAGACTAAGLVYWMGIEGSWQTGVPVPDGTLAVGLMLAGGAVICLRLSFAAADREDREARRAHRRQEKTVQAKKRVG